MKQIFTLLSLLVLAVGCGGNSHNAATLPISGNTGNPSPVTSVVYSRHPFDPTLYPRNYEGFKFYSDGTFEIFMTQHMNFALDKWVEITGTYTDTGSSYDVVGVATGGTDNLIPCGTPFVVSLPYTAGVNNQTISGITYDDESVSGLSRPNVSDFPNLCP